MEKDCIIVRILSCLAKTLIIMMLIFLIILTVTCTRLNGEIFRDNPLIHLVLNIIILILCISSAKYYGIKKRLLVLYDKRYIFYMVYGVFGTLFILSSKMEPTSDPQKLMVVAQEILKGDYSSYILSDGYMFRYPFQNGVVLTNLILIKLFGDNAYIGFQITNLLFQIIAIEFLGRIAYECSEGDSSVSIISILLLLLFPVFFLNIEYNYGNGISLSLIIVAMYYEFMFLRIRKYKYMLLSSIFAGAACVIKTNSLIMIVAMIICLLIDVFKSKDVKRNLMFIIAILIMRSLMLLSTNMIVENITGVPTPEGMPYFNWIAMGLTDEGNFNGISTNIFEDAGFDSERSSELAKEYISYILKKHISDKKEALKWVYSKQIMNWGNPTFDIFSILRDRSTSKHKDFYLSIFTGRPKECMEVYLNYYQSFVLIFSCIYLIRKKKIVSEQLMLGICCIGGFLFHIFWEGGARYTFPYFILLLPYAAGGISILANKIEGRK